MAKLEHLKALYKILFAILFAACAALGMLAVVGGAAGAAGEAGDNVHLFRGHCFYSHSNTGDPIVLPDSNSAHMHEFFGNDTTKQNSTAQSLQQDSLTC